MEPPDVGCYEIRAAEFPAGHRVLYPMFAQKFSAWFGISALFVSVLTCSGAEKLYSGQPIRALIVTGGCCHNYKLQSAAMTNGLGQQADFEWTVVNEGGNGTKAEIDLYSNPDWAKP